MVWPHHMILVVRVDLVHLQELVESRLGVLHGPVPMQFRIEVAVLRLVGERRGMVHYLSTSV